MLRRHGPPVPSETALINDRSVVRRLWRRKLRDGAEVTATLWWNNSIGAVVELEVHASFVSVDRPFPASSRNRFSQTPRRAQRTKRL
jgi:hypothetical protein